MEKQTIKGKPVRSTNQSASHKAPQNLACASNISNELKRNPSTGTATFPRKPLATSSFDITNNTSKFKPVKIHPSLFTAATTSLAKPTENARSDFKTDKVSNHKRKTNSHTINETRNYFASVSLSKLSRELPRPSTSRYPLRATLSTSNEKMMKWTTDFQGQIQNSKINTNITVRPKTVQAMSSRASSVSTSSVKKKAPGPTFESLSLLFKEKNDVPKARQFSQNQVPQNTQNRIRSKLQHDELNTQLCESLRSILKSPSPYNATTKLPVITNPQSVNRPRSRQILPEITTTNARSNERAMSIAKSNINNNSLSMTMRSRQQVNENTDFRVKLTGATTSNSKPKILPKMTKIPKKECEPKSEVPLPKVILTPKNSRNQSHSKEKPMMRLNLLNQNQHQTNEQRTGQSFKLKAKSIEITSRPHTAIGSENEKLVARSNTTKLRPTTVVSEAPSTSVTDLNENEIIRAIKQIKKPLLTAKSPKSKSSQIRFPQESFGLSSQVPTSAGGKPSHKIKVSSSAHDNISALLLQTLQLLEEPSKVVENELSTNSMSQLNGLNLLKSKSSESDITDTDTSTSIKSSLTENVKLKMNIVDNLPFPTRRSLKVSNENNYATDSKNATAATVVINPPVNTPVSPKSMNSDCSLSEFELCLPSSNESQSSSNNKNDFKNDNEDEDDDHEDKCAETLKSLIDECGRRKGKLNEFFGDDVIGEYLKLESFRKVNHIAQIMCRTKICREFKGADPNLSLEQLKLTKSRFLQLPCFADPSFFVKIKVPPNVFMCGKKSDPDLSTIQDLQNKMENLTKNKLKRMEELVHSDRPTKQAQSQGQSQVPIVKPTPINPLLQSTSTSLDKNNKYSAFASVASASFGLGNLAKDFYIQSLHNILQSLEMPNWAKDCFGSLSDDENEDNDFEDDDLDLDLDMDEVDDNLMENTSGGGDNFGSCNSSNENAFILFSNANFMGKPSPLMNTEPRSVGAGFGNLDGATLAQRILNIYESRKLSKNDNTNSQLVKKKEETNVDDLNLKDDEVSSDNQSDSS